MTDVPYVRITPAHKAVLADAEIRALGFKPVYRRSDSVIAAYATDRKMVTLKQKLGEYRDRRHKHANVAKIETIGPWSRKDRESSALKQSRISPAQLYVVDILLLPIDDAPSNPGSRVLIENFVRQEGGTVLDRVEETLFTAMRVRLGGQALEDLLEYRDDISRVDLPPNSRFFYSEALKLNVDDFPEVSPPEETAPAICIVDSGILEGHPLLEASILTDKSKSFPDELGPPIPASPVNRASHGTEVAGIALYGDVGACFRDKAFNSLYWLVNARILDDQNALHPDRMPYMRSIVEHARNRCKVFNLSFGLEPCRGELSTYSVELDALSREFGVLFVISSGNYDVFNHFNGELPKENYPKFMMKPGWEVLNPAESLNSLTVGGLTPDGPPFVDFPDLKEVGEARAPSPFSCSGSIKNVVKPELIELAGNLAFNTGTNQWFDGDPALRVLTTGASFTEGKLLNYQCGTSYSTPKVSNMAAALLVHYPEAQVNLIRALLVQSAKYPTAISDWPKEQLIRLCGFGVPNLDRALYCRPQRVTLYYQGTITMDEVIVFDVPVPQEFSRASGSKTITVTVAYDPPTSATNATQPTGIKLNWGLARGDVTLNALKKAIAEEAKTEREERLTGGKKKITAKKKEKRKSEFMATKLPKRSQQRGTIQKNMFIWKRGEYGETYRLALIAKAVRLSHQEDSQTYAVVVTLECEDTAINIYSQVRERLAGARVRLRVREK